MAEVSALRQEMAALIDAGLMDPPESEQANCYRCGILIFDSPYQMPTSRRRHGAFNFEWPTHQNIGGLCHECDQLKWGDE